MTEPSRERVEADAAIAAVLVQRGYSEAEAVAKTVRLIGETKPARERVEAYEKALGCFRYVLEDPPAVKCAAHSRLWTDRGCLEAVAAARVEAEWTRKLATDLGRALQEREQVRALAEDARSGSGDTSLAVEVLAVLSEVKR